jgi:hypothetical protein
LVFCYSGGVSKQFSAWYVAIFLWPKSDGRCGGGFSKGVVGQRPYCRSYVNHLSHCYCLSPHHWDPLFSANGKRLCRCDMRRNIARIKGGEDGKFLAFSHISYE